MKTVVFTLVLLNRLSAQALPVVPMQMDPDQLFRSLRDTVPPIPASDCHALDLLACNRDDPQRVEDVSIRWIQLDDDPELEAILTAEAKAEHTYVAYVFDKQETWKLVGSFFCQQWTCDSSNLIRVQKLTLDSPPLVLFHRDLGGSGHVMMTTTGYHLRASKLWPAFEVINHLSVGIPPPAFVENRRVLSSSNLDRLVIHTIHEQPPGKNQRNSCEVLRWDVAKYTFAPIPPEGAVYCDPKTGEPKADKSFATGLPIYP